MVRGAATSQVQYSYPLDHRECIFRPNPVRWLKQRNVLLLEQHNGISGLLYPTVLRETDSSSHACTRPHAR